ncbi:M56 family metallopeptidase [Chitinophaga sp. 212800010-3]|uniref:M56 family metallopeptidase n=1 Tax=unclassified Chitinophaga TaxID=2619133 RepID=UPI002DE80D4A|nr:TonB-dependent outer membrane receptor, SusC/RagA subfamily, signature region [Chitinophaga sp. 212800010-3]
MVPAILIYLLKANIALTLFYLAYRFGLRRLTFYTLNRLFLLVGIAFSSLFPLIPINAFVARHEMAGTVMTYVPDLSSWEAPAPEFTVWTVLVYIFWTGVSVMAIRFLIQLLSLWRLHRKSVPGQIHQTPVKLLKTELSPFSFFRNIYINPSLHLPEELRAILWHEAVHVIQWHSVDVILGEINNIFYWFNPGAWLMKTAIRENLEFITDRYLLTQGVDKTAYQYNLIKVSGIPYATAIANNFNFSHLKNRIIMMNSKKSSGYQLVRYLVLGALAGGLVLTLNYTRASVVLKAAVVTKDSLPNEKESSAQLAPPVVDVLTFTQDKAAKKNQQTRHAVKIHDGANPVYVIDGVLASKEAMEHYQGKDQIDQINVVKNPSPDQLIEYGKQANNGIIFVRLKHRGPEPITVVGMRAGKPVTMTGTTTISGNTGSIVSGGSSTLFGGDATTKIPDDVLVIVDGAVSSMNELSSIPKENLVAINVLKDESARAIYGERGRNGVILVTTKAGKSSIKEARSASDSSNVITIKTR